MEKVITVFKWEIRKLFSSWSRTVTLFLVPAVLLMAALNVFPLLINYMSTGSLNKKPVTVVSAPESFKTYVEESVDAKVFTYEYISFDEFQKITEDEKAFHKQLRKGMLICFFYAGEPERDFDDEVREYYEEIYAENEDAESDAVIYVGFDYNSLTSAARAEQFKEGVLKNYKKSLIDTLGGDYSIIGSNFFETDTFNPVTDLLDARTIANTAAARVVPGVLMIMMYYCVYSLVSDMFASERDRGFMAKLLMTPVKPKHIYAGKILAINVIVSAASYITMLLLFFSSWINRSNDAMSLLPFGMMLTPVELLVIVCAVPITVLLMTAICISIVFSLDRMQDITVNLQLPLILFLGDFFLQMFRGTRPVIMEYFVPLHNTMELVAETFLSQNKTWHTIVIYLFNLLLALIVLKVTFRKEESK
ncbi:MAG: ABC transporter permease [Clostridiales bacterium]|nr:ABC transporter permease [Clostridiales bacterium]